MQLFPTSATTPAVFSFSLPLLLLTTTTVLVTWTYDLVVFLGSCHLDSSDGGGTPWRLKLDSTVKFDRRLRGEKSYECYGGENVDLFRRSHDVPTVLIEVPMTKS